MILGTKAETLKRMEGKLTEAKVLPQFSFTVKEWEGNKGKLLSQAEELRKSADSKKLIVRSSALDEDSEETSQAGKYLSVSGNANTEDIQNAIEKVIASYEGDNPKNQVLIQPELGEVKFCGVAFTMDPNTGGHYDVIEFDAKGSTSAVTSGEKADNILFYIFKDEKEYVPENPYKNELKILRTTLRELERLFGQDNLDVEFAFTQNGDLFIFQTRALILKEDKADRELQSAELRRSKEKVKRDQGKKPFLCGDKAIYSVMTDWNPAEMIGICPKQLALSLYQEIITDGVWAYQRDNYGYRNLRSVPLMVDFGGHPYIDVRASFNSFIPAGLSDGLSNKLVNYYLNRLIENPQEHDKAEFNIVFSCYTFDLSDRISVLRGHGFSDEEVGAIIDSLRDVTNQIIDHDTGLWRKDYDKIEKLAQRQELIAQSNLSKVEKVYWLIEDCKRYGTLPFAGLARAAFIAVQILRSMVNCRILSETDYEAFINGVNTVSSQMNADFSELSKEAFLKKYGHLRPGTYDITSPRYDEAPDLYFDWSSNSQKGSADAEQFRLTIEQMTLLKEKLEENGLTNDILSLLDFIKTVIEGREYGKFVFTKSVSAALALIGEIGEEEGFSKEECTHLSCKVFQQLYVSSEDVHTVFAESIAQGMKKYALSKTIMLPPVILSPEDITAFFYPDSEPNYITSGKTTGEVLILKSGDTPQDLTGKIVLIEGADPGYDWIFSHEVKGFITMYGGANSHMAIRAGELAIPAAVGVGGKMFKKLETANCVEIDAAGKTIKILR